jgi:anaerobic selenocysteine-containing dehydrogenase
MPDLEPADADGKPARPGTTRRGMLRGTAGIGVAGLAAGVLAGVVPASASAATAAPAKTTVPAKTTLPAKDDTRGAAHDEPLVAVVHDARTGVVDLYTGTQHVRFTDHQLATRLARTAR